MTVTIDHNKGTYCACALSWSQRELLFIRGADDKERSSGSRMYSMLSQRKPGLFTVSYFFTLDRQDQEPTFTGGHLAANVLRGRALRFNYIWRDLVNLQPRWSPVRGPRRSYEKNW